MVAAAVKQDAHSRDADASGEGSDLGGWGAGAMGVEEERVTGGDDDEMVFGSSV